MNILGKILIIVIFVVTVFVLGFITHDFAARLNNQSTSEQFKVELENARKANQAQMATIGSQSAQITNLKADLEAKKQDEALNSAKWAIREQELLKSFKESEDRGKAAELNLEKSLTAQERMKKEVDQLKAVVEDREDRLIKLHAKYKEAQDLNLALHRDLTFSQERNQVLVARVQELERQIAEIIATNSGKGDPSGALPKDPLASNPPQKYMKGVVERVDATDKTLVRISLGTDHGLKVGETLEIFRLSPNAEWVGMIRIEDAHHHTSVGRLVRTPGTPPRAVREGDVVASTLSPR